MLAYYIHVLCTVFQFDGTFLATGSYDGYARLWSTDGKHIYSFLLLVKPLM